MPIRWTELVGHLRAGKHRDPSAGKAHSTTRGSGAGLEGHPFQPPWMLLHNPPSSPRAEQDMVQLKM